MAGPRVSWQEALFETEPVGGRLSFEGLRRDALDDSAWVDVTPGWLADHEELFAWLHEHAPWQQRKRTMWDQEIAEPRAVAVVPVTEPRIADIVQPLNAHYAVEFDSCLVNLYRDGNDAVAWHGDTVRKVMRHPLVATVSLGARRSFLLKPRAGGAVVRRYQPGGGDLMVMGGTCQHTWLHSVPRERTASGARMSVTLRHSQPVNHSGPSGDSGR